MTEIRTDVCVVGGGPGGLTLALLLLRSGKRVTVIEKARSLDRPYRGEILQPGGLAVLDALGVLDGARARGAYVHERFQLVQGGRPVLDIDYRRLPPPYDHLLSIPQRHLLAELLAHCSRYAGFTLLSGHRVNTLHTEQGVVRGAGTDQGATVSAAVVVGADGRYSRTRQLAGITHRRFDMFDLDVLWFQVPDGGRPLDAVRILHAGGHPLLSYRSWPDRVQIGWTLPHRGYRTLTERSVSDARAELIDALPEYADQLTEHVTAWSDLSLLDVFAADAREWVRDGLVLIGDAAHTHGPLGAQGLNLAIADAAVLHPVLLDALATGDVSAGSLRRYETARRPDIEAVMALQRKQSAGLLSRGRVASAVRPRVARLVTRSPIGAAILRRVAYGRTPVSARTDLFTDRLAGSVPG